GALGTARARFPTGLVRVPEEPIAVAELDHVQPAEVATGISRLGLGGRGRGPPGRAPGGRGPPRRPADRRDGGALAPGRFWTRGEARLGDPERDERASSGGEQAAERQPVRLTRGRQTTYGVRGDGRRVERSREGRRRHVRQRTGNVHHGR